MRDGRLAPDLKQGLHRLARPWYRLRALHVFLDNTNLAANPDLWSAIEQALDRARFLVLLASPEAARSPWVDQEIRSWRERRSMDRVLLAVTAGDLRWDAAARDFDWEASDALPRALSGAFADEPRWIDLRFARGIEAPSLRDPRFREAIADIAAPLHGRPRDELTGEDVRQHRRTVRVVRATAGLLLALAAAATIAAIVAVEQRERAEQQLRVATSRLLSTEAVGRAREQHSQALLLAAEALQTNNTAEARSALFGALVRLPQVIRYLQPRAGGPQDVAFSPDRRTLAAATTAGSVQLWDARSGRETRTLKLGDGPVADIEYVDARTLAAAGGDGRVHLLDPRSGRARGWLDSPAGEAGTSSVATDGRTLASGHYSRGIVLWDVTTGSPLTRPFGSGGGGGSVYDVALRPGGRLLAAAGDDGTISVWRLGPRPRLAKELHVRPGGASPGRAGTVAFSRDGTQLAAGTQDGRVATWRVDGWTRVAAPRRVHSGEVTSVAFSADGSLLASGGFDRVVRLWDAQSGDPLGTPLAGHIAFVSAVAFGPAGRTLASGGADGNVVLWDPLRADRLARAHRGAGSHQVSTLASSPNGRTLAWGEENGKLLLSDDQGTHELLPAKSEQQISSVAFSPNGGVVAAGVGTGFYPVDAVHLWRVKDRRPVREPLRAPEVEYPWAGSLSFSPNGRILATGSQATGVFLWDTVTGGRIGRPLKGDNVAFSPTGRLLAATTGVPDDGTVILRDRKGGPARQLETGSDSLVWDLAFSPDGRTLAAGDNDGNVVLWDVPSGRRLGEPLTGHTTRVDNVAFSPRGELLATSGSDGHTLLWDLEARRPLGPALRGASPAFSADGRSLMSTSPDGGIVARPVDTDSWRRLACSLANRNLGPGEWEQFLGALREYAPTCPGRERGRPAAVAFSAD